VQGLSLRPTPSRCAARLARRRRARDVCRPIAGKPAGQSTPVGGGIGAEIMFKRIGLVGLIYIIVGLVIAWERNYITVHLLKLALSAVFAVFLWWLLLLGVSLHLH
jgi:hypothetical protein